MKKNCLIILSAAITVLMNISCNKSTMETSIIEHTGIRMTFKMPHPVRSSINIDTDHIDDLFIYIFGAEDGKPVKCIKADVSDEIRFILEEGTYHIYAVANGGEKREIQREEDIRKMAISTRPEDLSKGIPMCWEGVAKVSQGRYTEVEISLEKLVATVRFTLDMGLPEGLEIISMRLCQGATEVHPFIAGGSRALTTENIADGDYATESDLSALMSGESICFHVPENCQGRLLPDNTDPWAKIPDNIPEKAGLCSYIEVKGRWKENAYYTGEITYRFFLGEDPLTSFDIRRNTLISLVLCPDEDNFDRINWKIDTSEMGLVRWNADSDLSRNFHDKEHFHVTERIRADFVLDRYGIRYWKARENRFILAGIGPDGATKIRFDDPICDGEGVFHAIGTCIEEGEFELVLCDRETGEMPYHLDSGRIIPPILTIGRRSGQESDKIIADQTEKDVFINGDEIQMDLFLTDQEGYNLNSKNWYGCDLSVCAWSADIEGIEDKIFDIRWKNGTTGDGGYASQCLIKVTNDGSDKDRNRVLASRLGVSGPTIGLTEDTSGQHCIVPVMLTCDDISIKIMPTVSEAEDLFGSEFMYVLQNPSNLPVNIRGLRLNSMNSVPADKRLRTVTGGNFTCKETSEPLVISRMPETLCSLCQGGAPNIVKDEEVWFASSEDCITQADMPSVQHCMFLVMEADLADQHHWSPGITGILDISGHADMQRTCCGMYFYTGDSMQDKTLPVSEGMTDFRTYGNIVERTAIEQFFEIDEVDIKINDDNEITAVTSGDTSIDVDISGTLYGHIRCITIQDPFDIVWGHYFQEEFHFDHHDTYRITAKNEVIDGSCIADAFSKMRNEKYYSALDISKVSQFRDPPYPDQYGTIREYLKPYGLDMSMRLSTADNSPIALRWNGHFTYEHTTSAPVTWPKGLFGYITIVPSTYSGYDKKVDEDGCPPGRTFIAETVTLDPEVEFSSKPELFLLSATPRQ